MFSLYLDSDVIVIGLERKMHETEAALAVFLALIVFGFIAIVLKICCKINECFLRDVEGGQLN